MKEVVHPAVIVKQDSNARLAEQTAAGILKNIAASERKNLRDHSDLGAQLVVIRKARKGDDFVATLKRLGISTSVAYEDIAVFENWSLVSGAGNRTEAIRLIKSNLLSKKPEDIEGAISSDAYASNGKNEEGENDVSPEDEPPGKAAPAGSGDAAEDAPEGALLDAEGLILPESVRPAVEGRKAVDEWVGRFAPIVKELDALARGPAGIFLPVKTVKNFLRTAINRVRSHSPAPKVIHRCNLCQGAGCAKCKKQGWLPKALLKET